jgi:PAS domain S-box-containing protein
LAKERAPSGKPAPRPWSLVLKVLFITFIAEAMVMVLLPRVLPAAANGTMEALLKAALLTALISPFIWWFVARPVCTDALADIRECDARRKAAFVELVQSENRLKAIIETVPECVALIAADGAIMEMNAYGLTIVEADSRQQVENKSVYALIVPEHRPAFKAMVEKVFLGSTETLEFEITGLKGSRRRVEARSAPLRDADGRVSASLSVTRDITDQRRLEAKLRHAYKMEAIGTLTGGIAHDFNNVLAAIVGFASVIRLKSKQGDEVDLCAERILASTERAEKLTRSLISFSGKSELRLSPVSLNEIAGRVVTMLRDRIGERITLKTELSAREAAVLADSIQLEQVMFNLMNNAADAMPGGGTLTLSTDLADLGNDFITAHGYGKTGSYAVVSVADTGVGLDAPTQERIFEPFFTTKQAGKGLGLGLSIIYGIVKAHNGFITCASEPNLGPTFSVYLPLAMPSLTAREEKAAPIPRGGAETILLAEDDREVRKFIAALLREFGYAVVEAEDGRDAVRRFLQYKDDVHLLLFDVILPGQDGKAAYDEIRRTAPELKVLFMSSYSEAVVVKNEVVGKGFEFILKPVSPGTLLNKVREVLNK